MNIDLVIVTFNRLEKLKKALKCYDEQTGEFRNLIVVNNCSSDGTDVFLAEWQKVPSKYHRVVITAKENLGGSGGFYLGQKYALEHDADWVFLADDDAYADKDMVKKFLDFHNQNDGEKYSAICAAVYDMEGNIVLYHRDFYKIYRQHYLSRSSSQKEDYRKAFFEINFLSYVGSFVNVRAMRKYGLVNPKYFIYFDDSEHSLRLAKYGKLICVPSIKITHEGGAESAQKNMDVITWRDYYLSRNEMNMLRKHFSFIALYQLVRYYFVDYQSNKDNPRFRLLFKAKCDGFFNRLGKHPIYKPGWSEKI
ncbi:glycosyltransferase [Prevotella sp. AGR2160]|uniref:glycosyltransferase n=1 Tax=Prevotella sp. AGR2160 TaxID=1280674 RepID=UPI0004225633|nr:glycosyltransferase [Prevotella sp. AGR2160]